MHAQIKRKTSFEEGHPPSVKMSIKSHKKYKLDLKLGRKLDSPILPSAAGEWEASLSKASERAALFLQLKNWQESSYSSTRLEVVYSGMPKVMRSIALEVLHVSILITDNYGPL